MPVPVLVLSAKLRAARLSARRTRSSADAGPEGAEELGLQQAPGPEPEAKPEATPGFGHARVSTATGAAGYYVLVACAQA